MTRQPFKLFKFQCEKSLNYTASICYICFHLIQTEMPTAHSMQLSSTGIQCSVHRLRSMLCILVTKYNTLYYCFCPQTDCIFLILQYFVVGNYPVPFCLQSTVTLFAPPSLKAKKALLPACWRWVSFQKAVLKNTADRGLTSSQMAWFPCHFSPPVYTGEAKPWREEGPICIWVLSVLPITFKHNSS